MANTTLTQTGAQVQADLDLIENPQKILQTFGGLRDNVYITRNGEYNDIKVYSLLGPQESPIGTIIYFNGGIILSIRNLPTDDDANVEITLNKDCYCHFIEGAVSPSLTDGKMIHGVTYTFAYSYTGWDDITLIPTTPGGFTITTNGYYAG